MDLENETPAAAGSLLAGLRARREKVIERLFTDLPVPRMDPPVYVRYGPVDQGEVDAANKRAALSKAKDSTVKANAEILAGACLGVFEKDADGEPIGDPEDWPRFGDDLAGILGVKASKASEIVRKLYFTDGDIISTCAKLSEWSGYVEQELEVDEGN